MVEVLFTAGLILIGLIFGSRSEKKHFAELEQREMFLQKRISVRTDCGPHLESGETFLVAVSVVVAVDYFKTFIGGLKNIFGGSMKTHESLLLRARREAICRAQREAICRAQEKALKLGARELIDVHLQTTFLDQLGAEVSVYATAVR